MIAARFDRRDLLKGALGVAAITATMGPFALATAGRSQAQGAAPARFNFKEVEAGVDQTHHVAEGYDAQVLIRWGDPVLPGGRRSIPKKQSAATRRNCSSATTTIISAICRCRAQKTRHIMVCWS